MLIPPNQRIRPQDLEFRADFINKALGAPRTYLAWDSNGHPVTDERFERWRQAREIGHYHISGIKWDSRREDGRVCLHRTDNEDGDVTDVFNCGYIRKRDLYNRMSAYLEGIERACKVVNGIEFDPHYNRVDERGFPIP